ncbi:MAG TPA: threonine-phosphate decarboxylase CobD [Xanthobacteraceae bacterium]|nr:threonine-phosphate decarboxylase CobD [Xanthobacteraceae bacterium]
MARSASATDIVPFSGADEPLLHGGDLAAARRLFPGAAEPFVDLSTGINPNPYPLPRLPVEVFARLPDQDSLDGLAGAAATAYGVPSAACVAPAPGTQILLPLVCGLVPPGRAAILTPTYSEHARAAALAGHTVTEVGDLGGIGAADLVVVTNPNNPDGRLFAKGDLLDVAKILSACGGMLVVDEAFMDVGPRGASPAPEVGCGNIVVLRSFGKFFGLAGLRLGFALAAPPLAARLSASLGPWAVSGPALAVGVAALTDGDWIEGTRRGLAAAATRLDAILNGAGLDVVGGTTLFRLTRTDAASALFRHLGRAGILTRAFPDHATWLRFGLPAAEPDWQRLQIAMAEFRGSR